MVYEFLLLLLRTVQILCEHGENNNKPSAEQNAQHAQSIISNNNIQTNYIASAHTFRFEIVDLLISPKLCRAYHHHIFVEQFLFLYFFFQFFHCAIKNTWQLIVYLVLMLLYWCR